MRYIRILFFVFINAQAFAQAEMPADPGPKFGPEFTFVDPTKTIGATHSMIPFFELAKRQLITSRPLGAKFAYHLGAKLVSPNGWSLAAATDQGAVEITTSPMTVEEFIRYRSEIDESIFSIASKLNLAPALFTGGGHISIDQEYLRARPNLYRNFLADLLVNHIELFMGIFGFDTNNALPQVLSHPGAFDRVQSAITNFDKCTEVNCLNTLLLDLRKIGGATIDPYSTFWLPGYLVRPPKYLAVSFTHVDAHIFNSAARLELRGVRPQASLDVWIRQIRLLRNRLRYLEKLAAPIAVKLPFDISAGFTNESKVDLQMALIPPLDAMRALEKFKIFVEESGERIEDHLDYVWPAWQADGSVELFKRKYNIVGSVECGKLLNVGNGEGRL